MLMFLVLLISSCTKNERLEYALHFAGDNRIELEKVLEHYQDSGLKYDAACFLIENMPYYYSYAGAEIDSLKKAQATYFYQGYITSQLREKWTRFSYRSLPKVYDSHVITAEYLIENIDLAFSAWKESPWKNNITFDEFCEWILPYRLGDEQLESWRGILYQKYRGVLDSLYRGNIVLMAADSLMKFIHKNSGEKYFDELSIPHLGALFLDKHCVGTCRENCDLVVYAFRAMGIPVTTDFPLTGPDAGRGIHTWNVLKGDSSVYPFEYGVSIPSEIVNRKGKVYRQCFGIQDEKFPRIRQEAEVPTVFKNPFLKEVTTDYFGENMLEVQIDEKKCGKYVYSGVFSFEGWIPVDIASFQNGKAMIKNIEPEIIFVPLASKNGKLSTVGYPFWLTDKGMRSFRPEKSTETVELLRKYPLRKWTRYHIAQIAGGRFEASETPDFKQSELLYFVADTPRVNYNEVICAPSKKYRYVRYKASEERLARIAELMLFRSVNDSTKLPARLIEGSAPDVGYENLGKENMYDGDYLTYFLSSKAGGYAILDLGRLEWIRKLVYVPRNDENFISIGDEYELFYQNGSAGWVSLGKKIAKEPRLIYDNVPKNALFWLHNLCGGREEQVFFMEDGKQIFLSGS